MYVLRRTRCPSLTVNIPSQTQQPQCLREVRVLLSPSLSPFIVSTSRIVTPCPSNLLTSAKHGSTEVAPDPTFPTPTTTSLDSKSPRPYHFLWESCGISLHPHQVEAYHSFRSCSGSGVPRPCRAFFLPHLQQGA